MARGSASSAFRIDPDGPPAVRQRQRAGPTATMPATWRDPDDMRVQQRQAREIVGHRAFCPLRWTLRRHKGASAITERHILAADRLRRAADIATIGLTGARDIVPIMSVAYGPKGGPSAAAMATVWASAELRRVMRRFDLGAQQLLTAIVLLNYSVAEWVRARQEAGAQTHAGIETERLVGALDVLAEFYASEIDTDIQRGATAL